MNFKILFIKLLILAIFLTIHLIYLLYEDEIIEYIDKRKEKKYTKRKDT